MVGIEKFLQFPYILPINIRISMKDYKEINFITSFIIDKRLHGDIFEL